MKIKKINLLNNIFVVFTLLLFSFSYTMEIVSSKNPIQSLVLYGDGEMDIEQAIQELKNFLKKKEEYTFEDKEKLVKLFGNCVFAAPFIFENKKHGFFRKISRLVHPDKNPQDKERHDKLFKKLNSIRSLMYDTLEELTREHNQAPINTKKFMIDMTKNISGLLINNTKETFLSSLGNRIGSAYSGLLVKHPKVFYDVLEIQKGQIESLNDEIEELLKQTNQEQSSSGSK